MLAAAALLSLPLGTTAHAQEDAHSHGVRGRELGIDLFGISYHYRSSTYLDGLQQRRYDQWNPGLGLHYQISESAHHSWMLKAGFYNDSKSNRSLYLGPMYQYRLTSAFSAGLGILLFDSETYVSPVIPLPLVSYRMRRLRLNATWIPAVESTDSPAVAAFATVTLWRR